jgi:uncharacterized protein (TIGR00255 family)
MRVRRWTLGKLLGHGDFSTLKILLTSSTGSRMIASMTGFGRGEASVGGVAVSVELRSVNNRFLEVSARLPRSLSLRENDVKEIVRRQLSRGKVTVSLVVERSDAGESGLTVNVAAAREYLRVLRRLRASLKIREQVKLDHVLRFPDVIEGAQIGEADEEEWQAAQRALEAALDDLRQMRTNEGGELRKDFLARTASIAGTLDRIEVLSRGQVPVERARLRQRIAQLLEGEKVDEGRLELELALLADRLDVTEECVRFRSHLKFFREALDGTEPPGRRLNFLVQEINREANTIGSKSSSSEIAHLVVGVKEEIERIREQLQNIE